MEPAEVTAYSKYTGSTNLRLGDKDCKRYSDSLHGDEEHLIRISEQTAFAESQGGRLKTWASTVPQVSGRIAEAFPHAESPDP